MQDYPPYNIHARVQQPQQTFCVYSPLRACNSIAVDGAPFASYCTTTSSPYCLHTQLYVCTHVYGARANYTVHDQHALAWTNSNHWQHITALLIAKRTPGTAESAHSTIVHGKPLNVYRPRGQCLCKHCQLTHQLPIHSNTTYVIDND